MLCLLLLMASVWLWWGVTATMRDVAVYDDGDENRAVSRQLECRRRPTGNCPRIWLLAVPWPCRMTLPGERWPYPALPLTGHWGPHSWHVASPSAFSHSITIFLSSTGISGGEFATLPSLWRVSERILRHPPSLLREPFYWYDWGHRGVLGRSLYCWKVLFSPWPGWW